MDLYELGFKGCVSQLRVNVFPEIENPFPFVDSEKVLGELTEEGEVPTQMAEEKAREEVVVVF